MRLILCGGGHVSHALSQIGVLLEFQVHVLDDRPEFAAPERFPGATVHCGPFQETLIMLGSQPDDFYCVLTRGHAYDRACVSQILRGEYAYLGMIGSRKKVAATRKILAEEGFSQAKLDTIHAPIGLLLGGQTPAEVAVEIAAELLQVRVRLGSIPSPAPAKDGILCTILKKTGSAPRGAGAWMLVSPTGDITGSVGGGPIEEQVRQDALSLWERGGLEEKRSYDLNDASELGMVCGGTVLVRLVRQESSSVPA